MHGHKCARNQLYLIEIDDDDGEISGVMEEEQNRYYQLMPYLDYTRIQQ